jgi:hypothetical protein
MAKTLFVVRAEIPDAGKRAGFEEWYKNDHLVADFDRVWPGIARRREMLDLAQELPGS